MALKEVCIAAQDSASGLTREGDIIVIREPRGEIGQKERRQFLWFLMDENDLPDVDSIRKDGPTRGNIALADLLLQVPTLDLARVRNPLTDYQPFVEPDPVDGKFGVQTQVSGVSYSMRATT